MPIYEYRCQDCSKLYEQPRRMADADTNLQCPHCGGHKVQRQVSSNQLIVIGVTLLTRAHVFFKDLEEGLQAEAAKHGYELIVTAGEFDLGKQSAQVNEAGAHRLLGAVPASLLEGALETQIGEHLRDVSWPVGVAVLLLDPLRGLADLLRGRGHQRVHRPEPLRQQFRRAADRNRLDAQTVVRFHFFDGIAVIDRGLEHLHVLLGDARTAHPASIQRSVALSDSPPTV